MQERNHVRMNIDYMSISKLIMTVTNKQTYESRCVRRIMII